MDGIKTIKRYFQYFTLLAKTIWTIWSCSKPYKLTTPNCPKPYNLGCLIFAFWRELTEKHFVSFRKFGGFGSVFESVHFASFWVLGNVGKVGRKGCLVRHREHRLPCGTQLVCMQLRKLCVPVCHHQSWSIHHFWTFQNIFFHFSKHQQIQGFEWPFWFRSSSVKQ